VIQDAAEEAVQEQPAPAVTAMVPEATDADTVTIVGEMPTVQIPA
jgi:hypothetical protein